MDNEEILKRVNGELIDASVAINCAFQILESTELIDVCTELWSLYRNFTNFQSRFEFSCGFGLYRFLKVRDLEK